MNKITMSDVRRVKGCVKGTKKFFERHGLDFKDFLVNGIEPEKILATGDSMGIDVVEAAKRGQQQ